MLNFEPGSTSGKAAKRRRIMKTHNSLRVMALVICLTIPGCITLQSSTISNRTGAGPRVAGKESSFGFLHLTVPQDLTGFANTDLVRQCPSGILTNVTTELKFREWFLFQYYSVWASAECLPPPPPPPAPVAVPPPAPQEKVVLRGVHFAFAKAKIREEDKPVLDEAAEILRNHPSMRVEVNGYTDSIGSVQYNLRLSERRANAVAAYLESKGIAADRLITQGFGKTNFVASNDTAEGRAQNRRVELVPVGQ
jgi:outer membrane protein OmpA-like peptidoglycan-associated protein